MGSRFDTHKAFIEANHSSMTIKTMAKMLNVNYTELSNYCVKIGFVKQVQNDWSELETAFLKLNYRRIGDKELAELLTSLGFPRTLKMVEKRRFHLKLKRTPESIAQIKKRNTKKGAWICRLTNEQKASKYIKSGLKMRMTYAIERERLKNGEPLQTKLFTRNGGEARSRTFHFNMQNGLISDKQVVHYLTLRGRAKTDKELKEALLKEKELIELKRRQIQLNYIIKAKLKQNGNITTQ
jgi:hypothetical protein